MEIVLASNGIRNVFSFSLGSSSLSNVAFFWMQLSTELAPSKVRSGLKNEDPIYFISVLNEFL